MSSGAYLEGATGCFIPYKSRQRLSHSSPFSELRDAFSDLTSTLLIFWLFHLLTVIRYSTPCWKVAYSHIYILFSPKFQATFCFLDLLQRDYIDSLKTPVANKMRVLLRPVKERFTEQFDLCFIKKKRWSESTMEGLKMLNLGWGSLELPKLTSVWSRQVQRLMC